MRELSRREFYLLLLAPGLLIVAVYCVWFDSSARKSLTQAEQSVAELRRSVATMDQTIAAKERLPAPPVPLASKEKALLARQMDNEKRLAELNKHPGSMLPVRWTTPTGRIAAIHMVESALEDNGLVVLSRQMEKESQSAVPTELDAFAASVKKDGNHPVPEVWRIDFVGSYSNMLAALDRIGQQDAFIIPLAATMKVLPQDSTRRIWSLWIWV